MKGKNLNIFVRFGGLNIKPQKGFGKSDTYHSPPAPRGFYAMPLIAQSLFLISSMDKYQPGTTPKVPTSDEVSEKEWEIYHKRLRLAKSAMRKQFLKKEGNIWHHLTDWVDRNEIIYEQGSWCKTSIRAWRIAFSRMSIEYRYGDDDWLKTNSINNTRGILGFNSKDHCEVFFDEKV